MAKDPAVLFYTSDFVLGTMFMTYEQKGQYIHILCIQHQGGKLPKEFMVRILGSMENPVWEKFEVDEEGYYFNKRMMVEAAKRKAYTDSRRNARAKCDEDNVRIYLIRDNETGNIKIGSSVNPTRRLSEMLNQTSPAILSGTNRDYELLWFSNPTIRLEEGKLHKKYKHLRVTGEWFVLTKKEIDEIRTLFHTLERTLEHNTLSTENENEDIDKDVLDLKDKIDVVKNDWNHFAKSYGLSEVIKLSDKRKSGVTSRLSEKEFNMVNILQEIRISDFLKGSTGWKVDFDFVFCSANNYLKILEGKYRNGNNQSSPKQSDATKRATFRHGPEQIQNLKSLEESLRHRESGGG